jgi:hypothetical protein
MLHEFREAENPDSICTVLLECEYHHHSKLEGQFPVEIDPVYHKPHKLQFQSELQTDRSTDTEKHIHPFHKILEVSWD